MFMILGLVTGFLAVSASLAVTVNSFDENGLFTTIRMAFDAVTIVANRVLLIVARGLIAGSVFVGGVVGGAIRAVGVMIRR